MRKRNNSDIYKIIRNFLLFIFLLTCAAMLIIGTQYAGDKAQYQLEGTRFETISYEDIKNSCINFFSVLK